MKKTAFFLLAVVGTFLTSCDPVAEDDRYVELEAVEAQRVVLLEEFTGQDCKNCPDAHRKIEKLYEQYGESFISVSIHAGSTAFDEGEYGQYFFKTPEGDDYARMWNVQSYPSGVVNRIGGVTFPDDWAALIRDEMTRPAPVNINLSAYLTEDDEISINAILQPKENLKGKLQLWIVEDSLVSVQRDDVSRIPDYLHNHVYRASVNGVGGDPVSLQENVFQPLTYKIPCRSYWTPRNLSVVGFVYGENGVYQAARTALVLKEE